MKELYCAVCGAEISPTIEHYHFRTNAFGDTILFCSEECYWKDAGETKCIVCEQVLKDGGVDVYSRRLLKFVQLCRVCFFDLKRKTDKKVEK